MHFRSDLSTTTTTTRTSTTTTWTWHGPRSFDPRVLCTRYTQIIIIRQPPTLRSISGCAGASRRPGRSFTLPILSWVHLVPPQKILQHIRPGARCTPLPCRGSNNRREDSSRMFCERFRETMLRKRKTEENLSPGKYKTHSLVNFSDLIFCCASALRLTLLFSHVTLWWILSGPKRPIRDSRDH